LHQSLKREATGLAPWCVTSQKDGFILDDPKNFHQINHAINECNRLNLSILYVTDPQKNRNDGRKVDGMIKYLSKIYQPINPIPVYKGV